MIDLNKIDIKQPKRVDNFMNSKITYDDTKFVIDLTGLQLLSLKSYDENLYCKLKLNKESQKTIMHIEEHLVDIVKQNTNTWFKSKMNADTIDEYFVSNITMTSQAKCVLKLRVESSSVVPDMNFIGQHVDIKLRLSSIRFLKTSFWVCYDILACTPTKAYGFSTDDDDDNVSVAGQIEDELGPDYETREHFRIHYIHKVTEEINKAQHKLDRLNTLLTELEANNFSLAIFDAVENAIA